MLEETTVEETPQMRVQSCICLAFAMVASMFGAAQQPETPHLAFVTEYVRELAAIETIRDSGKQESKDANETETLSNAIHINTLFQLELQSEILMLQGMRLNPPYDKLIPQIAGFYKFKIDVFKQLTHIVKTILAGSSSPKPNIDYAALAAEMPELRARLDSIDHTLFDVIALVCFTLVDSKADSKNHVSHMIITKAERETLIDALTNDFGDKLETKNKNLGVAAASIVRSFLRKYKCSDEPWE